tara:strand:- start:1375 stop:1623 length:249 start_codon:yes stop_codon:yes gene_type:complete
LSQARSVPGTDRSLESRLHGSHNAQFDEQAKQNRQAAKAEKKRVKKLEAELRRKEKALAETAALLTLSKKAEAIWGPKDEDE